MNFSNLDFESRQYTTLNNRLLEEIGQGVLAAYGDSGELLTCPSYIRRLLKLTSLPSNRLPVDWQDQVRIIMDQMSPMDFAIYGRSLTMFVLSNKPKVIESQGQLKRMKKLLRKRWPLPENYADDPDRLIYKGFPKWIPTYFDD